MRPGFLDRGGKRHVIVATSPGASRDRLRGALVSNGRYKLADVICHGHQCGRQRLVRVAATGPLLRLMEVGEPGFLQTLVHGLDLLPLLVGAVPVLGAPPRDLS